VLEHEVNTHPSLTVNLPLPLIVEYIAPPDVPLHPIIVTPFSSTYPLLLIIKFNAPPF
jgi:hypothetical protein